MKKFKNLVAVILVVSLIFVFAVPYSASSLSESAVNDSKIDSKLKSIMESASEDELIEVALWLSDVDDNERQAQVSKEIREAETNGELVSTFMSETNLSAIWTRTLSNEELSEQSQTLVELKRDVERNLHTENAADVLTTFDSTYNIDIEPLFVSSYAPLVLMEMTVDEINCVVNSTCVEKVYYNEEIEILEDTNVQEYDMTVANEAGSTSSSPYGVWQTNTNINLLRDVMGYAGDGVKIGLLGRGAPSFDYEELNDEGRTLLNQLFSYQINNQLLHLPNAVLNPDDISHENYTLSILTGIADGYSGVAPRSEIYCDYYYGRENYFFDPLENLLDYGVNIISASFIYGYLDNGYDFFTKYLDYVVSNSGVTLCFAAGYDNDANYVDMMYSSALAYNTITVGNIDDKNTIVKTDDELKSNSRYNGTLNSVYKPDICAPGARASTFIARRMVDDGNGGTSAACPIVAGTCALLMEAIPTLKTNPMLLKSLLMASAQNLPQQMDVYSNETSINPALNRDSGPGMLDAYKAYETYINGNYRSFNSYESNFNYAVNVSQKDINGAKDIFLSLNWLQWNTENGDDWIQESNYNVLNGNHHTLSLYDPDGQLVAVSDYHYDRKQFIRYKPLKVGRYTAKITRSHTGTLQYYPQFAVAHCIK